MPVLDGMSSREGARPRPDPLRSGAYAFAAAVVRGFFTALRKRHTGAVVVLDGRVVGSGYNRREVDANPLAHAELAALAEASRTVGAWRLTGLTLYVTLEPCAMCAGALVQSRVSRLVYGTTDPKAGAVGSLYNLVQDPRFNHRLEVETGVLADESAVLQVDHCEPCSALTQIDICGDERALAIWADLEAAAERSGHPLLYPVDDNRHADDATVAEV